MHELLAASRASALLARMSRPAAAPPAPAGLPLHLPSSAQQALAALRGALAALFEPRARVQRRRGRSSLGVGWECGVQGLLVGGAAVAVAAGIYTAAIGLPRARAQC